MSETNQTWIPCAEQLPPQGETVLTKIDDEEGLRNERLLKRDGGLWLCPDGSMYHYYRPSHWRPIEEKGGK